jgi:hypothetical protein
MLAVCGVLASILILRNQKRAPRQNQNSFAALSAAKL